MKYADDKRIVMTLDAGGTNFVFSAIQANKEVVDPITLPSNAHNLKLCLGTIVDGFNQIKEKVNGDPAAISFAFPGPADYKRGIIGDLGNLPAFRGGIALGPMLEEKFNLPVYINNDGDLYAYGEAIAGFLPRINSLLEEAGSPKRFKNLVGLTLGTGFGAGIVSNGELFTGDNSGAGEIWLLRNKVNPSTNAEEGASIRAVQRVFAQKAGIDFKDAPSPKDIFEIGMGQKEGNKDAALEAYRKLGEVVGDAIANLLTLIDGLAVIGGGVAGAYPLFLPSLINEMNGNFYSPDGKPFRRLSQKVYNLEDENAVAEFVKGDAKVITVPDSETQIKYDPLSRLGVGISKMGTSKAVAIGAYAYALNALDNA